MGSEPSKEEGFGGYPSKGEPGPADSEVTVAALALPSDLNHPYEGPENLEAKCRGGISPKGVITSEELEKTKKATSDKDKKNNVPLDIARDLDYHLSIINKKKQTWINTLAVIGGLDYHLSIIIFPLSTKEGGKNPGSRISTRANNVAVFFLVEKINPFWWSQTLLWFKEKFVLCFSFCLWSVLVLDFIGLRLNQFDKQIGKSSNKRVNGSNRHFVAKKESQLEKWKRPRSVGNQRLNPMGYIYY